MSIEEAQKKLELAKKQLERVQVASWEPEDHEEAINWAFYAYENGVVAAAEAAGIPWKRTHVSKAEVARELVEKNFLSSDVSGEIPRLNELRKEVQYGEPSEEMKNEDLEDLAGALEEFINEVEGLVGQAEEA